MKNLFSIFAISLICSMANAYQQCEVTVRTTGGNYYGGTKVNIPPHIILNLTNYDSSLTLLPSIETSVETAITRNPEGLALDYMKVSYAYALDSTVVIDPVKATVLNLKLVEPSGKIVPVLITLSGVHDAHWKINDQEIFEAKAEVVGRYNGQNLQSDIALINAECLQ